MITFKINGMEVRGEEGQYVLQVAEKNGFKIPTLCHHQALEPAGMCRLCTVELFDGRRTRFVTACNYPIWEGMEIQTDSEMVHEGRRLIVELLLARCPEVPLLRELAEGYGIESVRFEKQQESCILCGLCTRICDRMGANAISLVGRGVDLQVDTPYGTASDDCLACGACASLCPTGHISLEKINTRHTSRPAQPIPSAYDTGLKGRKPIYVPYAQAIPNAPVIDRDTCVYFKTGGCRVCADFCGVDAIDHTQQDQVVELDVGSIILAPGFEAFDPSRFDAYSYAHHPNVITSMEMERLLSASGPTAGHLVRPSDQQAPQKIAWFQCVGSRDLNRCDNAYCSAVCCMYAVKEAVIAKEHAAGELDCAVFFMDMRTHGKEYETYYRRAKAQGVRFVRARVHSVSEVGPERTLNVRYADPDGRIQEEAFDMVVLSVGMQISDETRRLAERLDIRLDQYHFAQTHPFQPVESSRRGIYVCGVFQQPKDIPGSVAEASAAACLAGGHLAEGRHTLTRSMEHPAEIDVSAQEPRIGVFVCHCGVNIAGVVDVEDVAAFARSLPFVVYAGRNLFTCSQDSQEQMKTLIGEHRLNRVVVAACTPKTHEGIFMDTLAACGLNKYLFEMANIRNQDSWVHMDAPEDASAKAKDLVRAAVARAARLYPLHEKVIPVVQRALVVGGGVAGMNAALGLADQGFEVVLVEKEAHLGGMATRLSATIEGARVRPYLEELVRRTTEHPLIQALTQTLIVDFSGFKGNFTTEVLVGPGMYERKIDHGAVVLATGASEYRPQEFLYGQDERVVTQVELAELLDTRGAEGLDRVVMIQCVGSRNDDNPGCSRICCQSAVKNALHIKRLNPRADIFILYRDMRTYGLLEDYYREARQQGIIFSRFDPDEPPKVASRTEGVRVTFRDHVLGRRLSLAADRLVLSAGMRPSDTEELASILKLARTAEGYFMEAHVKLRPVDMATEGIFVCGTAHGPKLLSESISQAYAAAGRAVTFLSQSQMTLSAVTARVDDRRCASCLVCVRSCPYGVPRINAEGVSEINEALCHGCGVCAAECPAKAIELNWYEDLQITSKIDALLEGAM